LEGDVERAGLSAGRLDGVALLEMSGVCRVDVGASGVAVWPREEPSGSVSVERAPVRSS